MALHCSPRRWLHIVGSFLGAAGVVFIALRLEAYEKQIDFSNFDVTAWTVIGFLSITYGTANVLLARAWWYLLCFLEVEAQWKWAVRAYGLSQVAKYVPGNIFHLAGRQAIGMAAGFRAKPLAKSAVWELALIALAGALFGVLALPLLFPKLSLLMSFVLFLLITAVLLVSMHQLISPSVAAGLSWHIVFLAVSGTLFISTLSVVVPDSTVLPPYIVLCGAYVIAWLAGLLTPGAPAGVGVREMVLLFLLSGQIAEADLLLAVVLGRGVTVFGDLFFLLVSMLLQISRFADE